MVDTRLFYRGFTYNNNNPKKSGIAMFSPHSALVPSCDWVMID